ncbi:MAG: DNA mismatch endonuclease Vsr [Nitrospiraceae bacterium]|nr:DNA mismatch endonuclease Vsr [Nitrospiraceae bacterium]
MARIASKSHRQMVRTDVHDKATRSFNMSRIRSKNTKPEIIVRKFLFGKGFRYKLYDRTLPGTPDLVFPKFRTVIFIHGCFWHGHEGCKYFVIPKTRREWWITKINRNKQLDTENIKKLGKLGWKVITIFECRLTPKNRDKTLSRLAARLAK